MRLEQIIGTKNKFGWLFASSISVILSPSFFSSSSISEFVFMLSFSILVIISVYCISDTRRHFRTFAYLGIATLIIPWLSFILEVLGKAHFRAYGSFPFMLFFLFIVFKVIKYILKQKEVTLDLIYGAISGYILLGLVGGIIASQIDRYDAHAFSVSNIRSDFSLLYYCFVTMSTLGYGDIVPHSAVAKSFSVLLTVFGQFYMAVIVAVLISKYVSFQSKNN